MSAFAAEGENTPESYAVTYNANGGTGTAPTESGIAEGETFTAADNPFTAPEGKQFKEWNTASEGTGTGYAEGAEITMLAGDLTLYAVWEDMALMLPSMSALAAGDVTNDNYEFNSATGRLTIKTNAGTAFDSDNYEYASTNWRHTSSGINPADVRTVIIEGSVTVIGEYAFACCTGLIIVLKCVAPPTFSGGWASGVPRVYYPAWWDAGAVKNYYGEIVPDPLGTVHYADYSFSSATGTLTIKTNAGTANDSDNLGYASTHWAYDSGSDGPDSGINLADVRTVIFEDGVTEIGNGAFFRCELLASVTIPDSVTSIGDAAFYGCESLASVTIPAGVTSIGESAFFGCKALTSVTIPASVTFIGDGAFYGCESLSSVAIPAGVTSIGEHTFSGCKSLTAVYVAEGNSNFASIGGVLYGKSGGSVGSVLLCPPRKAGALTIPDGVTSIGNSAFSGCGSLTSVMIPDSVTSIGESAFQSCTALTSITIPDNVTSIGNFAFAGCTALMSVTIPDSVTQIGEYTFAGCTSLIIVLTGENSPSFGINWANAVPKVYYPAAWGADAVTNYSGTLVPDPFETADYSFSFATGTLTIKTDAGVENWRQDTVTDDVITVDIQSGVTSIGESAFESCSALTSVTIPDGMTSIGNYAFSGCESLTSVTIPDGVTSIGECVFQNCESLTSVTIPASMTSIGNFAFSGCESLTSVTIPNSVTSIGECMFYGCTALTSVTIPDGVTSIGNYAFCNCYSLASVTIPDRVTSIGESAFESCSALTSVTIPASVTSIGHYAFFGCYSLTAVNVVEGNPDFASIDGVVYGKSGGSVGSVLLCPPGKAGTLTIPDGVTSIGNYAFESSALMSVTIPDSVTSIGDYAFYGCTSLIIVLTGVDSPTFGEDWADYVPKVYYPAAWGADAVTNYSGTLVPDSVETTDYSFSAATGTLIIKTNAGTAYDSDNHEYESTNWLYDSGSDGPDSGIPRDDIRNVIIEAGVTSIGESAFESCSALTSVTIPASVTSIGYYAFFGCNSLTAVNVAEGNPNFASIDGVVYGKSGGSVGSVRLCPPGKTGALTIPDGVTSIGNYAFVGCSSLMSVTIPASVTSIGEGAFAGCESLASVATPDSVTSIGYGAFYGCTGLTIVLTGVDFPSFGEDWASGVPAACYPAAWGEPDSVGNLNASGNAYAIIDIAAIGGVTVPVRGALPVSTITETTQYTGTITWEPADSPFKASTVYTATIALTPKTGYTLTGVAANFFTVAGVTATNAANSGVITAVFPATGAASSGGGSPSTPTYNADVTAGDGSDFALPITVNTEKGTASVDTSVQNLDQGGTVITVPSIPDVDTYTVGIPISSLSTTDAQGTMTIDTNAGSVTVPSNMLTGVSGISGNKAEISIGQGDKDSLPDDVRAAIGDKPLIQLTLSIDGKQTNWSNPDAPVTVSIPYTPTPEERANPESIVIWYIDGSGNAVTIPNGHYDPATGMVTFDTNHFSDYAVAYNKVSFNDVVAGAWYNKAVSFIAARGITGGTGNGNYSPDAKLTRGEFLVMLMKAYGIAPDTNSTDNFSDAGNTYYTGYLAAAKRLGITAGVGNNQYAPGKAITRQEMFTLLYNALKVIGQLPQGDSGKTLSDFADAGQIDSWAKDAMTLLVETGTVGGNAGKLSPTATTTRAEMAQVLYNLLGK